MKKTQSIPFILSSKEKYTIPYIKSVIKTIDKEVMAELETLANDDTFGQDISNIFFYFLENFTEKDIPTFLMSFETNLEKSSDNFPQIKNIEKIKLFFSIIEKLYIKGKIPRQKAIQRKSISDKFKIDPSTFNQWLIYFDLEKYIGLTEFTSKEYSEIIKALVYVNELEIEVLSEYHFQSYNKISLAEIIKSSEKSNKTKYKNLSSATERIDDIKNEKLISWLETHHKMPFSIAYQWVSLILESQNNKEHLKTEVSGIFKIYYSKVMMLE